MYGLNSSILGKDNPNSPFYENPCCYCRQKSCEGCEHCEKEAEEDIEYNPDKKDEELSIFEAQTEFYKDNL